MGEMTELEADLVRAVLEPRRHEYPGLWAQMGVARVRSREVSPCGGYVNFVLPDDAPTDGPVNRTLGVDAMLEADDPPNGLGFVVEVTDGRLNYLELFTYLDDTWDGTVRNPRLVDIGAG